jgi:uncharacterized membrane protein (UPF0127 family)
VPAHNLTRATLIAEHVEVGSSLWAKFIGLMGRRSLAPGASLWLPDSNGIHMMFMRFPIDAIFLGKPGKPGPGAGPDDTGPGGARQVISVHRGLPAWTGLVPLVRGAHGCLELSVGAIDASGTRVGDWVALD